MPPAAPAGGGEPRTYGNWRKPATPGLPGLGLLGTAVALGGVVLAVLVQMVTGLLPAALTLLVVAVVVCPLLYRNRSGRNGWQAATARARWLHGRRAGQHVYRSGLAGPVAYGPHTLPGLLAASVLYECTDSYGQPFAMLHVPATRHFSVVLKCDPEGSQLVDADTSDTWVARWGSWLAELPREPNLHAASATVETAPDPGSRLAREVDTLVTDGAPDLARRMLAEVTDTYALGSPQVTGRVALTFTATRRVVEDPELLAGRAGRSAGPRARVLTPTEMAAQIGSRLPGLVRELAATGVAGVRALTGSELAQTVRVAYDPAAGPVIEAMHARSEDPGVDWTQAGPAAHLEDWGALRHDSGTSVTWQMTEAPRGAVGSQVLRALLEPNNELTRKRVTLLYRPHDPATSAKIAHNDVRTALGRASMRAGEGKAAETLDLQAARQTAGEEAAGAGLTRFSLLVTATVTDPAQLGHVADLIDQAGGASRLQLRRVYAGQSAAFAAGLGVGLVLNSHVSVPAAIRQYL